MQIRLRKLVFFLVAGFLAGCQQQLTTTDTDHGTAAPSGAGYVFERGFPTSDTAQKAYDDADLNRAIEAYRFF